MAETVTVIRIDTAEVKEMIAEKYNVPVSAIRYWNGRFEIEQKKES